MMHVPIIKIENLKKSFNNTHVLKGVNLDIYEGKVITIIGESGSGKSTLLRCINSLETYEEGNIYFKGQNIKEMNVNNLRSQIGMVFQQFNLFNNLNVLKNCTIGLIKVLKMPKQEAEKKALEMLTLVGMEKFINANVNSLSGGQKQMLSLSRALVQNNPLILVDEPSKGLAPVVVDKVVDALKEIKDHTTILLVEQNFAMASALGDRFYILDNGQTQLSGSMQELAQNEELKRKWLGIA